MNIVNINIDNIIDRERYVIECKNIINTNGNDR